MTDKYSASREKFTFAVRKGALRSNVRILHLGGHRSIQNPSGME
jgi:hypothetical protein